MPLPGRIGDQNERGGHDVSQVAAANDPFGLEPVARADAHDAGPRRLHYPGTRPVIACIRQDGGRRTERRVIEQLGQPPAQQRRQIARAWPTPRR